MTGKKNQNSSKWLLITLKGLTNGVSILYSRGQDFSNDLPDLIDEQRSTNTFVRGADTQSVPAGFLTIFLQHV